MYKVSHLDARSLAVTQRMMQQIYEENPKHWPNGLTPGHFDGGLYLIRKSAGLDPIGFCGWQERLEWEPSSKSKSGTATVQLKPVKVGYYSIGLLPAYRGDGLAKEALTKLIAMKSAGVDQVRALIMSTNAPSIALADALGVTKVLKQARLLHRFS